jgi:hypothetical protein
MELYMHVQNDPIIEESTGIQVAEYGPEAALFGLVAKIPHPFS